MLGLRLEKSLFPRQNLHAYKIVLENLQRSNLFSRRCFLSTQTWEVKKKKEESFKVSMHNPTVFAWGQSACVCQICQQKSLHCLTQMVAAFLQRSHGCNARFCSKSGQSWAPPVPNYLPPHPYLRENSFPLISLYHNSLWNTTERWSSANTRKLLGGIVMY